MTAAFRLTDYGLRSCLRCPKACSGGSEDLTLSKTRISLLTGIFWPRDRQLPGVNLVDFGMPGQSRCCILPLSSLFSMSKTRPFPALASCFCTGRPEHQKRKKKKKKKSEKENQKKLHRGGVL